MERFWVQCSIDVSLLPVYQEAARRYPNDPLIRMFLIRALEMLGEEEKAQRLKRELQKQTARLSQPQPFAWYNTLFKQIKQELAQSNAPEQQASSFSEKAALRQRQLRWVRSCMRRMVTGMVPWRLAVYKEAAKRFPRDPVILITLWQAFNANGREQEAEQVMDALIALWEKRACKPAWLEALSSSEGESKYKDFGLLEELPSIAVSSREPVDLFSADFENIWASNIDALQWYNELFEQIEEELEGDE